MLGAMTNLGIARAMAAAGLGLVALVLACDERKPDPAPAERAEPRSAPGVVEQYEQARRHTQCIDAQMIAMAVEMHRVSDPAAACPTDVDALVSAKLLARVPNSAPRWSIACSGDDVIVSAPGSDGQLGTADDVVHGGPQPTCTAEQR
jgi:hypothetical protein